MSGAMKNCILLLLLGLISCVAGGEEQGQTIDQALLNRLNTEGIDALFQLEKYFSDLHIEWYCTVSDNRAPYYGHYFPSKGGFLTQHRWERNAPPIALYLSNKDYFSEISKDPDETAWKLDNCVRQDHFDPEDYMPVDDYNTILPFTIRDKSLAQMIRQGEITITEIANTGRFTRRSGCFRFYLQT